jgi:phosphoribosylformylglycinamidine (FGAM) synthase PurS component
MKLYEIADQYLEALDKLQESEELDAQTIADTLEGLSGEVEEKMKAVAAVVLNLEAYEASAKRAAKNMTEKSKRAEAKASTLKRYLKETMDKLVITVVVGDQFDLKIKKNPPSLRVFDETTIPKDYFYMPEVERELDNEALKADLLAGKEIAGAEILRPTRLEIR